jgi:hypothetical protein
VVAAQLVFMARSGVVGNARTDVRAVMDTGNLRRVRARQRIFAATAGALLLLLVGAFIWKEWIGWTVVLGLLGLALVTIFLVPPLVLSLELRRRTQEERSRAVLGDRYDRLFAVVFAGLVGIDPFRSVYKEGARRDGRDYEEYYDYDVRRILRAIAQVLPGDRSASEVREAIYRTLKDNAYGNLRGGVGSEDRYTNLALRVLEVLEDPGFVEGE